MTSNDTTGPEGAPERKPRRAFTMTVEIGADSREQLIHALNCILFDIDRGSDNVTSGGYDSGYWFTVTHNPEMTHDRYVDELNAYLEANP